MNSREQGEGVMTWRRRSCARCKRVMTTQERLNLESLFVTKRNGTRQRFIYEKLFVSIFTAIDGRKHRDNGDNALLAKRVAETVVEKLLALPNLEELSTGDIIRAIYAVLIDEDPLHAERYAYYSEYRRAVVEGKEPK